VADEPQEPAGEPEEPHSADGLDLARSLLRSAMGSSAPAARPRPQRKGEYGERPGLPRRLRKGEAQLSGAHPDGRDPQMLSAEVDRIIGDRGWGLDLQIRGVFARWPELVGSEIGTHSTPESLVDGVLVVRAHSTAWATQLKLLVSGVIQRLNQELGPGTVTVVEVLAPNAPSWKHGLKSVKGRGPRDTYG
jgi:predicted nucleic acid-binding Zn ribbon protein